MTAPRLVGEDVSLLPVPLPLVEPVLAGDAERVRQVLDRVALRAARGWPHDDTAAALVAGADDLSRTWLVAVGAEVVGECGWKGWPDADGTVEISYGLAAPSRGLGIGTGAVALLVAWTQMQPSVRRVAAEVLAGNEASRRLLRRLGFDERQDDRWVRAERATPRVRGRHVC